MMSWLGLNAIPRLTAREQAAYETTQAMDRTKVLIWTVISVCGFYLFYTLVDLILIPDVFRLSVELRFGVVLPLAILLLGYLRGPSRVQYKEAAALTVAISGNIVWCILLVSSKSPFVLNYYFAAVVFQTVIAIASKAPFKPSLVASLVTFAINYTFIWFLHGATDHYVLQHFVIYCPVVVLTLVTCHQLEAERLSLFRKAFENEELKAELSRQNRELGRLSFTDPLTQLANRRGTAATIETMRKTLSQQALGNCAFFVMDIDHFKAFNDNYGHAAGDVCLAKVANALRQAGGEGLHVGRHGGEEFVAVLPDCSLKHATDQAERLCEAVLGLAVAHAFSQSETKAVTISIGVARGSIANEADYLQLVKDADTALYRAKEAGRNRWSLAKTHATLRSDAA